MHSNFSISKKFVLVLLSSYLILFSFTLYDLKTNWSESRCNLGTTKKKIHPSREISFSPLRYAHSIFIVYHFLLFFCYGTEGKEKILFFLKKYKLKLFSARISEEEKITFEFCWATSITDHHNWMNCSSNGQVSSFLSDSTYLNFSADMPKKEWENEVKLISNKS